MKNTILRYGIFSVITLVITGLANFFISRTGIAYHTQEILGYASILLSMIFVFLGIKQYRDKFNGGFISYGKALKIGLLIVILPSIAFGLFDLVYSHYLDPEVMNKYYNQMVEQMRASVPASEFPAKLKELEASKAMFQNGFFQFFIMATTVMAIGFIVAVVSAFLLKKKAETPVAA
jgi:hypothetical protein